MRAGMACEHRSTRPGCPADCLTRTTSSRVWELMAGGCARRGLADGRDFSMWTCWSSRCSPAGTGRSTRRAGICRRSSGTAPAGPFTDGCTVRAGRSARPSGCCCPRWASGAEGRRQPAGRPCRADRRVRDQGPVRDVLAAVRSRAGRAGGLAGGERRPHSALMPVPRLFPGLAAPQVTGVQADPLTAG